MFKRSLACTALLLLAACREGEEPFVQPVVSQFSASPITVAVGENVTYSWTVAEAVSCQLDVDGDGAADYTPDCTSGSQTHTFSEAGTFEATLTAAIGATEATETAVVNVTEPSAPQEPLGEIDALRWQPTTPQPYGVAEGQGVAVGGKLYVFGGFDSRKRCCTPTARAHVFDPATQRWQAIRNMPEMNGTGYGGVTHAGIATDGTDIFLAGGYTSSVTGRGQIFGTREVWRYVVAENRYTRLPNLPVARAAGQLEHLDGKLYYFGGTNQPRTRDTGELFILDLESGGATWRTGARLPNPRNHMGSAVLGGKVYAIGGQHDHDQRLTTQRDVHAYTPETDSWDRLADLPLPVSHIANSTFVLEGRIYTLGGEVANFDPVASVFAYSPETDAWETLTPLPLAIQSTVAKSVGERIVMTGGAGGGWRKQTYFGIPIR